MGYGPSPFLNPYSMSILKEVASEAKQSDGFNMLNISEVSIGCVLGNFKIYTLALILHNTLS